MTAPIANASSVSYVCDGHHHDTIYDDSTDVTNTPYWAVYVVSIFTVVPMYPCGPTGGDWGATVDYPFVNGADLQQYSGPSGIVQIGESWCTLSRLYPCAWPVSKPLLVYTSHDTGDVYTLATWWNQGLGAGILKQGDTYEVAVLRYGSTQWEFAAQDLTASTGWTYHTISKTWATAGGNLPWWGFETNNYASAMTTDISHNPATNYMRYETSDATWHQDAYDQGSCPLDGTNPGWYNCFTYNNGYNMESWTNAH